METQFNLRSPDDADISPTTVSGSNTVPPAAPAGRPPMPPGGYRPAAYNAQPPVYPGPGVPYPKPTPRPAPAPIQKPAKKGPGIGTRILLRCIAIVLSFLLFITLLAGIVIYDGKTLISPDRLYTLLEDLKSKDYRNSELLLAVQDEMVYWVNELFAHEYGSYYHLDRDDIVDFLEESTVYEFVAEKAAGYIRDILDDTHHTRVTTRELKALYKENKSLMEKELGIHISPEINDQILQNLERINVNAMIDENLFAYLDGEDGIDDDLRDGLELVSTVFSDSTFLVCIIIAAILAIALVLCNRLRPAGSLVHIGIPMVLAGGAIAFPLFMATSLYQTVLDAMDAEIPREGEYLLNLLVSKLEPILTPAPLLILCIGSVFLLAAPIVKLIFKKK